MTMVCELCGREGIRWMGPLSNLTHTECPLTLTLAILSAKENAHVR